jgi:uridine monophosphate synthetase
MWHQIVKVGCVQRGKSVVLKSGISSDLYIDLRKLTQHPRLLQNLVLEMVSISQELLYSPSVCVAGIPMGAIHLATLYSQFANVPQILIRKEPKTHGTRKLVEMDDSQNLTRVILIEDVITTGASVLEVIELLKIHQPNLQVVGVVCLVNRGQLTQIGEVKIWSVFERSRL